MTLRFAQALAIGTAVCTIAAVVTIRAARPVGEREIGQIDTPADSRAVAARSGYIVASS